MSYLVKEKTRQTYSYDNLYQLIRVEGETTYNPYRSSVPEFVSNYSQDFTFDELGLGNMTSKVSKESVRPNKKIGDNLNYNFTYVYDENYVHRLVRAGDRYYKYDLNGNIICEQDGSFESNENDTAYHKIEQETEDVYSTDYGWGFFKEDKTGSTTSRYRRTYTWNERNQLISSVDANYSTAYVYGQDGQRSNKYTENSETLYFNKMWTHHTDSGNSIYGGQTSKNIYLGETRIVTKLNSGEDPTYQEEYYKQYYYHSDHLGSASLISDYNGNEYQRIEYTPYGETWVEKTQNTGLEYLPYKFTAKELDEETGLYYYGARYLDPKYSMWISTDPALGDYVSKDARGEGGIYNPVNLSLYHYAGNNPINYTDPDGRKIKIKGGFFYRINVALDLNQISKNVRVNIFTGNVKISDRSNEKQKNGTLLLTKLINDSDHLINICYDKEVIDQYGNCCSTDPILSKTQEGADSTVYFDPNRQVQIPTVVDEKTINKGRDPSIGLGHELIHALHNAMGENANDEKVDQYTNLTGDVLDYSNKSWKPNKEELRTVGIPGFTNEGDITENMLREEQDYYLRSQY